MKRILSLLMILCMLLCSCSGTQNAVSDDIKATEQTKDDGIYTIEELGDKYKFQGRKVVDAEKGIGLLSTGDSFEFNADCEGKVLVKLIGEKFPETDRDLNCYFTTYIDGERTDDRFNITDGKAEIVIAEDIAKGSHSFRVVRQTEWEHGKIYIQEISLTGEITAPPDDKDLYIEFIGDSIATGFGNLPEIDYDAEWGGHPIWEDGTQAFAYMTAERLDADYSIVAVEGIGAIGGHWNFTMNEIYNSYPDAFNENYTYTPERTADIVVVELFSNDHATMHEDGYTPSDIAAKGKELCEIARALHPDAKIIVAPGAFAKKFETMINEELGGETNGYYYVDLPMDMAGKSGHPTVAGQTMAADALVAFIEEILTK